MLELKSEGRRTPPPWSVRQRALMQQMERAAAPFVAHAARPDGTLVWRSQWTSMDGTDNAYEAFLSLPLFYLLGAGENMLGLARREFDAITWQFEDYGTVEREFVTGFDWFHHSESYTYLYYLAMADPEGYKERVRAVKFAAMYTGDDPLAPNYDAERRMLRSPLNGSRGPRFQTYERDWNYHRPILSGYLAPYEDLPGADSADPLFKVDWTDDAVFEQVLAQINARMTRGDVPLNLSAASLVTHAFLYTGESRYRDWVLDYLQAWIERRDANGGLVPDNVGPQGRIGELMDGKWWGGYYGWRWPHGARNIVEPALVAGSCAQLMTGDPSWLELARSQLDRLWELRRQEDGIVKVPARHGDQGWFDFRPPDPYLYIHLWYLSQSDADRARLEERFPDWPQWTRLPADWGAAKAGICPPTAWYAFNAGRHPAYPEQVLHSTCGCMIRALDRLDRDDSDPEQRECYHFQNLNPVVPEALVQMAMGTPAAIYNGGLLQSHLRYFDPGLRRAGLPQDVAALVEQVTGDSATVLLVNLDPVGARSVVLQAGGFAEHEFTAVSLETGDDSAALGLDAAGQAATRTVVRRGADPSAGQATTRPVDGSLPAGAGLPARQLIVRLEAGAQARVRLGLRRFAHAPTYAMPDMG